MSSLTTNKIITTADSTQKRVVKNTHHQLLLCGAGTGGVQAVWARRMAVAGLCASGDDGLIGICGMCVDRWRHEVCRQDASF